MQSWILPFYILHACSIIKFSAGSYALEVAVISDPNSFELKWNDGGSGGDDDGAFYRPIAPTGFWPIGHYGQTGYGTVNGQVLALKALESGALAHPIDYHQIWADSGSGADMDGSFWLPIPPSGYVCMGILAQHGYGKPSTSEIMCVRSDLTSNGQLRSWIWDDSGTGADSDFGAWKIDSGSDACVAPGTFVAVSSHNSNDAVSQRSDLIKCLNLSTLKAAAPPTRAELDALIQRFGPKLYFHTEEAYVISSAEWFLERSYLLTKATNATVQATADSLPQGEANGDLYQLVLKNDAGFLDYRKGDLSTAKAYVHAKG